MKKRERRTGPFEYYKGKYFIVFYDETDEKFLYAFNNVREILVFQKKEVCRQNVNLLNVELYRALRRDTQTISFLTGAPMHVYIIDIDDET